MSLGWRGVLIAEDDPADAELIVEVLREDWPDEPIHVACDGADALDFVYRRGRYESPTGASIRLLLLDLKLPRVDGLDVVRELKADPKTRSIPVVMFTSSRMERDVALGYRLGVNSYVQKPVEFGAFRATVQRLGAYWLAVNEPDATPTHLRETA